MDDIEEVRNELKLLTIKNGKFNGNFLKYNKQLKKNIENLDLGEMITTKEKIWAILNSIFEKPKCYCGNLCNLKNVNDGFFEMCSKKCSSNSKQRLEKIQRTNLEKYGSISPFGNKEVQEKTKSTNLEKYGVLHNWQIEDVKTNIKQTNLEKYGDKNPTKFGSEKFKEVMIEKYGVENAEQSSIIREKRVKKYLETYKQNVLPIRIKQLLIFNIVPLNWSIEDYNGADKKYEMLHKECGNIFNLKLLNGSFTLCPYCSKGRSKIEQKLYTELEILFPQIKANDRTIIKPYEIDILIDNIGIEVNGVYWHREQENTKGLSLLEKSNLSPIQILHFWDYELQNKFDICKSIICAKLGKFEEKIMARKCKIRKLSSQESRIFFNQNHLSGHINSSYYLGLEYNGEIVQALSIGSSRFNKNYDIELHRLATKLNTSVIGGVDKLFAQVKKDFTNKSLISYADKRYSDGAVYKRLGFTELKDSSPNFFWIKDDEILSRYSCQKHKLPKLLGTNYNPELTAEMNMEINKFIKIKDCGNKVLTLQI